MVTNKLILSHTKMAIIYAIAYNLYHSTSLATRFTNSRTAIPSGHHYYQHIIFFVAECIRTTFYSPTKTFSHRSSELLRRSEQRPMSIYVQKQS